MSDMIVRKCDKCKNGIEINKCSIENVIYYNKKYFHKTCFEEIAAQRSKKNIKSALQWKEALENINQLEFQTKKMLKQQVAKDDLNSYLLEKYNISIVPNVFWQLVADLENGIYKRKKCKPIDVNTLLNMWRWGQVNLDKIDVKNKIKHMGPQSDDKRIFYDLAILIKKLPQFISYKKKQQDAQNDMIVSDISAEIDISRIGQGNKTKRQDVSNIADDLFVE